MKKLTALSLTLLSPCLADGNSKVDGRGGSGIEYGSVLSRSRLLYRLVGQSVFYGGGSGHDCSDGILPTGGVQSGPGGRRASRRVFLEPACLSGRAGKQVRGNVRKKCFERYLVIYVRFSLFWEYINKCSFKEGDSNGRMRTAVQNGYTIDGVHNLLGSETFFSLTCRKSKNVVHTDNFVTYRDFVIYTEVHASRVVASVWLGGYQYQSDITSPSPSVFSENVKIAATELLVGLSKDLADVQYENEKIEQGDKL